MSETITVTVPECQFCAGTENLEEKASICGNCAFFFYLKLRVFSPSTAKNLTNQEKPITYLKHRLTDRRLSEEARNLIKALLKKRVENLTLKKLCRSCETKCEHIGDHIIRGKSQDVKRYCCICLPKELHTKPQESWICEPCSERKEHLWQCKDCKRYIPNKDGNYYCKFLVDYEEWNDDCPQFKPKNYGLTNRGRIIYHLKDYYDLSKRANYAPVLADKIIHLTPLQWEILDDLIEAGCELIIGQVMSSHLVHGWSKKNTIIVPHLVINSEKVYEVDIPLSSDPRNYKPRKKAQVFYEVLEDHIDLGGDSQ